MKLVLCIMFSILGLKGVFCSEVDQEEIEKSMFDRTKKALMSYEIVEEKTKEVFNKVKTKVENSAIGNYKTTIAAALPFATGKIDFKFKKLHVSYNHFSDKTKLDYALNDRWEVFFKRKKKDGDMEESSGVGYSLKF